MKLFRCLEFLNLSKLIAKHLMGENHTKQHHRAVGIVIIIFGVLMSEITPHSIRIFAAIIGQSLHGIGLIPFINELEKTKENEHTTH